MATDVVINSLPRIVHGGPADPYKVEVTITRQTEILPAGLVEIHIDKSPKVPEGRATDVMQHALIDILGHNPPFHIIMLPNGEEVPAFDWFDHTGRFTQFRSMNDEMKKQLQEQAAGSGWGRNSLWLVLNQAESNMRAPVLQWFADKLWGQLISRHTELRAP
jgi:hypothetical protein